MIKGNNNGTMEAQTSQLSALLWTVATIFGPISLPWMIYYMVKYFKQKSQLATMPCKTVLITGASSGIGEALAHTFYKAGCKVVLAARDKEQLQRVREELLQTKTILYTYPPLVLPMDLTDLESLPANVEEISRVFGNIDILINNAAIGCKGDIVSTSLEVDMKIMQVNYFGAVAMTKAVLPSMLERKRGHLVFMSCVAGRIASPSRSSYVASKHALQSFCDTLRAEVTPENIKVLVVSPANVNTTMAFNALTGSGEIYGVTDPATATGYDPAKVADTVLKAVLDQIDEVLMTPIIVRVAMFLRYVWPSAYFFVTSQRPKKL